MHKPLISTDAVERKQLFAGAHVPMSPPFRWTIWDPIRGFTTVPRRGEIWKSANPGKYYKNIGDIALQYQTLSPKNTPVSNPSNGEI